MFEHSSNVWELGELYHNSRIEAVSNASNDDYRIDSKHAEGVI